MESGVGNASWLEIAYSLIALVGLIGASGLGALAWLDESAVATSLDRYARRYARKLRREGTRKVLTHLTFLAAGIVAMATPPPALTANQRATTINSALYVLLNAYLTYDTIRTVRIEYWARLRLWSEDRAWNRKEPPK